MSWSSIGNILKNKKHPEKIAESKYSNIPLFPLGVDKRMTYKRIIENKANTIIGLNKEIYYQALKLSKLPEVQIKLAEIRAEIDKSHLAVRELSDYILRRKTLKTRSDPKETIENKIEKINEHLVNISLKTIRALELIQGAQANEPTRSHVVARPTEEPENFSSVINDAKLPEGFVSCLSGYFGNFECNVYG